MPRTGDPARRRKDLLPALAGAFAELGYRRTTTAELARRCGVQETILYRLWPDKRRMFQAAIEYVYENSLRIWGERISRRENAAAAADLLEYEAKHHGEFGLYRIVFAGMSDRDDPEIRQALRKMYSRFHGFIKERVEAHCAGLGQSRDEAARYADLAAWTFVGLGTVANIGRELGLISDRRRAMLFREIGARLLEEPGSR